MPDDVAIIDTSSVIRIREIVVRAQLPVVFIKLTQLVQSDKLVFPKEVQDELERWTNPDPNSQDPPLVWAQLNAHLATRHVVKLETVKAVVNQVPEVIDEDKLGVEEADPYVLALAIQLQEQGKQVTVLTEDRKDRPDKMSITTACGVLRLPCLPVHVFLKRNGIWQPGS